MNFAANEKPHKLDPNQMRRFRDSSNGTLNAKIHFINRMQLIVVTTPYTKTCNFDQDANRPVLMYLMFIMAFFLGSFSSSTNSSVGKSPVYFRYVWNHL